MNRPKLYTCPNCGRPTPLNQKTAKLPGGIQHVYFKCARCGKATTVYYTDLAIRKMLARQKELRHNTALAMTTEERAAEIAENKAAIEAKMAELRRKMAG